MRAFLVVDVIASAWRFCRYDVLGFIYSCVYCVSMPLRMARHSLRKGTWVTRTTEHYGRTKFG